MDKLKLKKKKKRREQQRKAEQAESVRLAAEFNEHYRSLGLRHDFKPKQVKRAYAEVQKECTAEAIRISSIATLWSMHKLHGYGARRLFRLAVEITARVAWIGQQQRTVPQLYDELLTDAKLDCRSYFTDYAKDIPGISGATAQKKNAIMKTVYFAFPIHAHAVYYTLFNHDLSRQSVRLKRAVEMAANAIIDMVMDDRTDEYIKDLEAHGFQIDEKGRFGSKRIKDAEYELASRRIGV